MTLKTLLPVADVYRQNALLTNAATVTAALTDNSVTTRIALPHAPGESYAVVDISDISLGARERIKRVRVVYNAESWLAGSSDPTRECDLSFTLKAPNPAGDFFHTLIANPKRLPTSFPASYDSVNNRWVGLVYGPWVERAVGANGEQEWTKALLDQEQFVIYESSWKSGAQTFVANAWIEAETNFEPTVEGTGPNAIVSSGMRPIFAFRFRDEDNDRCASARIKLFTREQTQVAGFNASTATPAYDSGEINVTTREDGAFTWQPPMALSNGTTYRAYCWVYDGNYWSSSNEAYAWATISVDPPRIPVLTVSSESNPPRVQVSVSSFDNLLSANGSSAESGLSSFAVGSNCTLSNPSVVDAPVGNKVVRMTAVGAGDMTMLVDHKAIPVQPGQLINAMASIRQVSTQRDVQLSVQFWSATSTLLATVNGPIIKEMTPSGWALVYVTKAVVPVDAVVATLVPRVKSATANEAHDVDALLVSAGELNLIRDPHGLKDLNGDSFSDSWQIVNEGPGPAPTTGYSSTNPIVGDRSASLVISGNGGNKGIAQYVSLTNGTPYAALGAWVRADRAVRVDLTTEGQGGLSTSLDLDPGRWMLIGLTSSIDAQPVTGRTRVRLTTAAPDVVLDWGGFVLTPVSQDQVDAGGDPLAVTRPNNWGRGGITGRVHYELERSEDGGKSWTLVRRTASSVSYFAGIQSLDVTDWEIPQNTMDVVYRARALYVDPVTNETSASYFSFRTGVPSDVSTEEAWLISLDDPSLSTTVNAYVPLRQTLEGREGVFSLLGRENPVTLYGDLVGVTGELRLDFDSESSYNAFLALRKARKTVLLVLPTGESRYINLSPTVPVELEVLPFREASVQYRSADRPPVSVIDQLPTVPDVVTPTDPVDPTPGTFSGLLDRDVVPFAAWAYSLRRLSGEAWNTVACVVERLSDHATAAIGFTSSGDPDLVAIAAHCAGTVGKVIEWKDQTGNGRHAISPWANARRIFYNGSVELEDGAYGLRAEDATRGAASAEFSPHTGSAATVFVVAATQSGTAAFSPRMSSLIGVDNTDANSSQGAVLVSRLGGGTPQQTWALQRSNGQRATKAAVYGKLQQIVSKVDGSSYSITVDGETSTGTATGIGNFQAKRIGSGFTGTAYVSAPNDFTCEQIGFFTAVGSAATAVISADQMDYFGTSGQTAPPVGSEWVKRESQSFSEPLVPSEWGVYNNGPMTRSDGVVPGAWMSRNVGVANGKLRIRYIKNPQPFTFSPDGKNFYTVTRESGAAFWKKAFKKGGRWCCKVRCPKDSLGSGLAVLLWPDETAPFSWPNIGAEIDILELYPTNATKVGGESNLHQDTVAGSNRKLKIPGPTTNSPALMVQSKNYRVDWTDGEHLLECVWINNSHIEVFIDGESVGRVTDQSFVPHDTMSRAMRLTVQIECYGVSDSAAVAGPLYYELDDFEYYELAA